MKKILFIAHVDKASPYAVEQKLSLIENQENDIAVVVVNVPRKHFIFDGIKQIEEQLASQPSADREALLRLRYLLGMLKGTNNRLVPNQELIRIVANMLNFPWLRSEHVIYVRG